MIGVLRRYANYAAKELVQTPIYYSEELMSAWQVEKFGGLEQLVLSKSVKVPELQRPDAVRVKVTASSVNPLDVYMLGGYGNAVLECIKQASLLCECKEKASSSLILGRDFCGTVLSKGGNVRKDIKIGDTVYGVVPPHQQGSHADQLVIEDYLVQHKPENITAIEAASLPYTSMTAWSALKISGDLGFVDPKSQRVLVLGASGGVGTAAVQLLKAWGSTVVATCSSDAIPLVQSLGADLIIDYTQKEAMHEIELAGKYDIILDAAGNITSSTYVPFLKNWSNSKLITLRSPFLRNTDDFGIVGGMVKNAAALLESNLFTGALNKGSTVRWGFFAPLDIALKEINTFVKSGKVKPVIDSTFKYNDIPEAFKRVKEGHLRGKIAISHEEMV